MRLDPNHVLTRYGVERFLYRLSCSPYGERFVLKGALLLPAWLGETLRPTRDADFLGPGDLSDDELLRIIREVCQQPVPDDGMAYDDESVTIQGIREEDAYGGKRVTLFGYLGNGRVRIQVDIGIGDAMEPPPVWLDYPGLLEFPAPRLRAYRPETVVAEKVQAMVQLGAANTRMKDFYDVYVLTGSRRFEVAGRVLEDRVSGDFSSVGRPRCLKLIRRLWLLSSTLLQGRRSGLPSLVGAASTRLGVTFLESEYTTGPKHGGRVDTLGIDDWLFERMLKGVE